MFDSTWYDNGVFAQAQKNPVTEMPQNTLKGKVVEAKNRAYLNKFSKQDDRTRRNLRLGVNAISYRKKNLKAAQKLSISSGDIVCHFYFSFWRGLFSRKFEPQLWNFGLKHLFPSRTVTRGQVSDHLEVLYKVRNRIAHQEFIHPALCRKYLISIKFLTKNMRLKGKIRKHKIYKFQEPYIKKIEYQLTQLEHLIAITATK